MNKEITFAQNTTAKAPTIAQLTQSKLKEIVYHITKQISVGNGANSRVYIRKSDVNSKGI